MSHQTQPATERPGLQLGLRVPANAPGPALAAFARNLETLGFHAAWVPDTPFFTREMLVSLTAIALGTRTLRFGSGVTNPITRHPTALAAAFATLQDLSGGRAFIGIGVGDSAVRPTGLVPAKRKELSSAVTAIRAMVRGQAADFGSGPAQIGLRPEQPVPVYIAAAGPRTLELAGQVADGVFIHVGAHPVAVQRALEHVAAGAHSAGRTLADLDVICNAYAWHSAETAEALPLLTPIVASFLKQDRQVFDWMGWDPTEVPAPPDTGDNDLRHVDRADAALAVAGGLDPAFVARFAREATLVLPVPEIRTRLEQLHALGVKQVVLRGLSTAAGLPEELAGFYARSVITP